MNTFLGKRPGQGSQDCAAEGPWSAVPPGHEESDAGLFGVEGCGGGATFLGLGQPQGDHGEAGHHARGAGPQEAAGGQGAEGEGHVPGPAQGGGLAKGAENGGHGGDSAVGGEGCGHDN